MSSSGNKEAGELLDTFNDELTKADPKKSILRSIWDGLVATLPTISQMSDIVEKVTSLFK